MAGQITVPDVSAFGRRFPEFASTTPDIVGFALEEAGLFMTNWTTPAAPLAQLYLAAHIIACAKIASESSGQAIEAETLGRISVKYTGLPSGVLLGDVSSTVYGRRYQQLKGIGMKSFKSVRDHSREFMPQYSFYWGWP
jgi:Protein of unknown function (DUF4054)